MDRALPRIGCVKCTQNQLTVQGYTKPVDCTSVYKNSLLINNVHKTLFFNTSLKDMVSEHEEKDSVKAIGYGVRARGYGSLEVLVTAQRPNSLFAFLIWP